MGLLDEIHAASQSHVRREPVIMPKCGKTVVVRTLMSGPLLQVQAMSEELKGLAIFAYAAEDPANPGKPIVNWNSLEDRQKVAALHPDDLQAVVQKHNELMGAAEAEAGKESPETGNSSTSSPSASASLPQNSGTA